MAARDDAEASVVLDVDEHAGDEVLGVEQVGQDAPVDLAGHAGHVSGAGGRGTKLPEHDGGGANRGEALAAYIPDQQPHGRRARHYLVEVTSDLRLDRRGKVAGRQRDRTDP